MILARQSTKGIHSDVLFSWTVVNGKIQFCQLIHSSLTSCTQFVLGDDVSDWVVIGIHLKTWGVM